MRSCIRGAHTDTSEPPRVYVATFEHAFSVLFAISPHSCSCTHANVCTLPPNKLTPSYARTEGAVLARYACALASVTLQASYLLLVERSRMERGIGVAELMLYNALLSLPFLVLVRAAGPLVDPWWSQCAVSVSCSLRVVRHGMGMWCGHTVCSLVLGGVLYDVRTKLTPPLAIGILSTSGQMSLPCLPLLPLVHCVSHRAVLACAVLCAAWHAAGKWSPTAIWGGPAPHAALSGLDTGLWPLHDTITLPSALTRRHH